MTATTAKHIHQFSRIVTVNTDSQHRARTVCTDQENAVFRLQGIEQLDNERTLRQRQHITLCNHCNTVNTAHVTAPLHCTTVLHQSLQAGHSMFIFHCHQPSQHAKDEGTQENSHFHEM